MSTTRGRRRAVVALAAFGLFLAVGPAPSAVAANGAMAAGDATAPGTGKWQVSVRDDCHDEKESCAYQDTSASGPRDIWAVGDGVDDGSGPAALVRHWDGKEWSTVGPKVDGSLRSVSTKSADETWLAGYQFDGDRIAPLSLRWNGDELERLPVPAGEANTTVDAVSVGKGSPWMVGSSNNGDGTYTDLAWRWTGKKWAEVKIPDLSPKRGGLVDVAASADDDVWVLGDQGDDGDHYVQHWDGTRWTKAKLPSLEGTKDATDIQVANGDVYVIGDHTSDADPYQETPFVQTMLNGEWQNLAAPEFHGTVTSMARDGKGGLWLAGSDYDASASRLDHWDGKEWTSVPGPDGSIASLTNIPDTTDLWSSGGSGVDDEGYDAFVAKYLP